MSTPATFVPNTNTPTPTPKQSPPTLGSPWRQRLTPNYWNRKNYDDEQEEKKEAELKKAEWELAHPLMPNFIETQQSTSVFDTSLARANAPQPHY
jgi:hypothetical protein